MAPLLASRKDIHELTKSIQALKPAKKVDDEGAYVCCKKSVDQAKQKVMDLEGPNAVYNKDEHTVYYHRKILASRIKKGLEIEDPHGDVAKEILKAMSIARKYNKDSIPKLVRL